MVLGNCSCYFLGSLLPYYGEKMQSGFVSGTQDEIEKELFCSGIALMKWAFLAV